MNENESIKLIKQTLKKIRPYLQSDGGDLDFVKFEDGIVYIRLLGACIGCSSVDQTVKGGIEAMLLEDVPGVIGVEQIDDMGDQHETW